MFVCFDCLTDFNISQIYKDLGPRSYGPCEICKETKPCLDGIKWSDRKEIKDERENYDKKNKT